MILKIFSFFLLCLANFGVTAADLIEITPEQLESMQKQQQPLVVDIRSDKEWAATGVIPNSQPLQFFDSDGSYDLNKWLTQIKAMQKLPEQPLVLVCRSGRRSAALGKLLMNEAGIKEVYHLSNGLNGWTKAGKLLEKACYVNLECK